MQKHPPRASESVSGLSPSCQGYFLPGSRRREQATGGHSTNPFCPPPPAPPRPHSDLLKAAGGCPGLGVTRRPPLQVQQKAQPSPGHRTNVREARAQGTGDIRASTSFSVLTTHLCGFGQAKCLKSTSQDSWEEPRLAKHLAQGPQGGHGKPISHLPPEPAEPRAGTLVQAAVGELGWWRGTGGHRPGVGSASRTAVWPKAPDDWVTCVCLRNATLGYQPPCASLPLPVEIGRAHV